MMGLDFFRRALELEHRQVAVRALGTVSACQQATCTISALIESNSPSDYGP
jgi:hypothetical protein